MTGRQLRRRTHRHPILATVVVLVALVVVANIAAHMAGLIILATAGVIVYFARRNRRTTGRAITPRGPAPVQPPKPAATWPNIGPGPLDHAARLSAAFAERDQLAAELADLRRQLADAAAERPPASRAEPEDAGGKRAALLAQPLSGARPLGSQP